MKNYDDKTRTPFGSRIYYLNKLKHRTDGPAFESHLGYEEYWLYGELVSKDEHGLRLTLAELNLTDIL